MIITTSQNSPDTLPLRGYSVDQLKHYILRQLGSPVWEIELSDQQVLDCIQDALNLYSLYCPTIRYQAVPMTPGQNIYLEGVNCGQGVVKVDFVEPLPTPTAIFYGNLIDPVPLFRTGMDDYDTFLRWRKTWLRVMSIQPDWLWDVSRGVLMIHNPLQRYHAGVICYFPQERTEHLTQFGAQWVKEYALEQARRLYGEVLAKFSGAIPGPLQPLTLDTGKREAGLTKMEALKQQLFNSQELTPISID